jgi:hypothetical protein
MIARLCHNKKKRIRLPKFLKLRKADALVKNLRLRLFGIGHHFSFIAEQVHG